MDNLKCTCQLSFWLSSHWLQKLYIQTAFIPNTMQNTLLIHLNQLQSLIGLRVAQKSYGKTPKQNEVNQDKGESKANAQ